MENKSKKLLSVFALLTAVGPVSAMDLSSIFNRGNRTLEPPPRDVKSTNENFDYRLESEEKRFSPTANVSSTSSKPGESLTVTTDDVSPVYSSGSSTSNQRSSRYRSSSRSRRRPATDGVEGFNGDRVFGVGVVGAGVYGTYGAELEFAFDDRLNFGAGLGTGMTYSSWGVHGKYFFNQSGKIETFIQAGYANWQMTRAPSFGESAGNYLAERFFFGGDKTLKRHRVDLFYPAVGMMAQFQTGVALSWQLQYLVAMHDFSGGLFGSLALHYYF